MQPPKKTYKPAYLDYVYKELLIFKDLEELPPAFHAVVKANLAFKTKLENFKQFIDCLSADRCFSLWIWETEELLAQSEETLRHFSQDYISEDSLIETHYKLAEKMCELTERVYEGHWEYAGSREADQQFHDLTELCRRIWSKESKAWITLAKVWKNCNPMPI